MIILPIVERELRVASRRGGTYLKRVMMAGVVAALGAYMVFISSFLRGSGNMIFTMVAGCLGFFAVASGWESADSISREKREGTIGFLFLTDLKGFDIVLGKLAASAVPAIHSAIGVLPVLAIALLLGGVSMEQFWEASFALLNLFFFSHAVAVLGSALFRNSKNSAGFPFLVFFIYLIAFVAAQIALDNGWPATGAALELFNPWRALGIAMSPGPIRDRHSYLMSLMTVHLTGWLFVGFASVILPFCWQERGKKLSPMRVCWERWRFGSLEKRAALQRELSGVNAFFWLASRRQSGPMTIWITCGTIFAGLVCLIVLAMVKGKERWSDIYGGFFVLAIVVFHLALKLAAANFACEPLRNQRASGGLELLLCCTPLSTKEIISGIWLGLRRCFLGPAWAVIVLGLCLIMNAWTPGGRDEDNVQLIWFILTATLLLVPDMIALGWTGMWLTMSQPKNRSAAGAAFLLICLGPWFVIGFGYAMAATFFRVGDPLPPWIFWIILSVTMDLILCSVASRKLAENFRQWAVPAYDQPLTFLGRMGRILGKLVGAMRRPRLASNKLVD